MAGDRRVRAHIAEVAARLMIEEGVGEYLTAKRIAAKRVLGRHARGARFRPGELPSNGEIQAAVLAATALAEGEDRTRRLFAMRVVALDILRALERFHPRLIGSVWSGRVRRGSDVDVHVFADTTEPVEACLGTLGWPFRAEAVLIRQGSTFRTFHHLHLEDRPFPVELSVYPVAERRVVTRSSVDGRPIDRVSAARLEACIAAEHPDRWTRWRRSGELDLDGLDGPRPGRFDSLLG